MNIGSPYTPRLPQGLVHEERDSLHLFLHPTRPRWILANRLGREIIDLCDGHRDLRSIASMIAERHGLAPGIVEEDVRAFIQKLETARLLSGDDSESRHTSARVSIRSIFLHLTDRCNLRCVHCYVDQAEQSKIELTTQIILDLLDELARMGGRAVTLSGGEPLLRPDCLDVLEHAGRLLDVTLNTNGTLIQGGTAERLARLRPNIQISLDGADAATHDRIRGAGSFEAAMRGVRELLAHGLRDKVIISMTLMRTNIAKAPEMIGLAESLGVSRLRFLPLHGQGRARRAWSVLDPSAEEYLRWFEYVYYDAHAQSSAVRLAGGLTGVYLHAESREEEPWCSVGRTVVIDASGAAYPCPLMMDGELCLGNVNETSLDAIQNSSKLRRLTEDCVCRTDRIENCRRCRWRNLCQGSCPALVFLEKGTLWDTDVFCGFRQRLYGDLLFRTGRRALGSTAGSRSGDV